MEVLTLNWTELKFHPYFSLCVDFFRGIRLLAWYNLASMQQMCASFSGIICARTCRFCRRCWGAALMMSTWCCTTSLTSSLLHSQVCSIGRRCRILMFVWGEGVAQLVEHGVWRLADTGLTPWCDKGFPPRVNFHCRLSYHVHAAPMQLYALTSVYK